MSLTSQHFGYIIDESLDEISDEIGVCHEIDKEDRTITFNMSQTEPFEVEFTFLFNISEECNLLNACGFLGCFNLEGSPDLYTAYKFCNEWNNDNLMPRASVKEEENKFLCCDWVWNTGYEISDELLKEWIANFIKLSMQCINQAVDKGLYPKLKDAQQ